MRDTFRVDPARRQPIEIEVYLTLAETGGRPAADRDVRRLTDRRRSR